MFFVRGKRSLMILLLITAVVCVLAACGKSVGTTGQALKPMDPVQLEKIAFLNGIAEEMYTLTMSGQVSDARNKLSQIADQIPKIQFEGITSVEGLNALTQTITEAKRVYNAANYSPAEGQIAVAKIRLATDALTHKNQPMWLQYYKVLLNDSDMMRKQVKANNPGDAIREYGVLVQHIAIIHPSLLISREPSSVEKLDSLLRYIGTQVNTKPMPMKQIDSALTSLNAVLDELFMKHKDALAYVPLTDPNQPIIWSISMGFIIVSVLSYVGWRMRQSGRHIVPVKQREKGENI
ncbi:sporulation protein YpjB [Paenibacillus roseipurpureus]|uniref:Sporulation protein YpjB n=1 Tax=Paenibacillus roseopurpureus TaxID=2918901 RepID=A0AA96RGP9_9BACL|nr:sporulation protein YpjB [Paenibacillus sp. MBLB1832]WNR42423.1 sporulation protein YpjB [Paenibacillus sp. MBLB1832]